MADSSERFVTVFDVSRTAFHWQLPALGLLFVIIGLALPAFIRFTEFKHKPRWMVTWYPRIFLSFALVWTLLTLIVTSVDDFRAKDAMRTNKAIVVDGHVSDFLPAPYTGHQLESFTVHGVHCRTADRSMKACPSKFGTSSPRTVPKFFAWMFRGRQRDKRPLDLIALGGSPFGFGHADIQTC